MHHQMRKDAFVERIVRGNLSFLSKIKVASSPAPYYYYEKCSGEGSTRLQRERLAVAPYAIFLKSKRRSDPFAGSEGAGGGDREISSPVRGQASSSRAPHNVPGDTATPRAWVPACPTWVQRRQTPVDGDTMAAVLVTSAPDRPPNDSRYQPLT